MVHTLVITGASGFLGHTLTEVARDSWPEATLLPLNSPRHGGIDLAKPSASGDLEAAIQLTNPREAILIHAAALVKWSSVDGLMANVAMAVNVATWARAMDIGFSVLVSGVNVYPDVPFANIYTPCCPTSFYGIGKVVAEHLWRLLIPEERSAIVRLAGIWGWQPRPTLFWNTLLLAAARGFTGDSRPIVRRKRSRRNYISAREASECLLQVASNRMAGMFLAAGKDVVDTETFINALETSPDSRLSVDWQDDGGEDEKIYEPSIELLSWLKPFPEELPAIWKSKPDWVMRPS